MVGNCLFQLQTVEEPPYGRVGTAYQGLKPIVPALSDVGGPRKPAEYRVVVVPRPGVEGGGFRRGAHPGVLEVGCELLHIRWDCGFEEAPSEVEVAKRDKGEGSHHPEGGADGGARYLVFWDQVVLLEVRPQGLLEVEGPNSGQPSALQLRSPLGLTQG